ncbi:transposase [Polaromonas sp. AER18D-145]|uniref:transposase n=1 Tax=Polaromonas sp. AER18D-145 TaxID=1977060 RepID=UPI000BBCB37E|nr:transposase [Polaromonas sp. AER18D-145]
MDTPERTPKPVTRRKHSAAFKRKLLRLCEQPGASVAAIALEHGVNANLVFKWRRSRQCSGVGAAAARSTVLLPVCLAPNEGHRQRVRPCQASRNRAITRKARLGPSKIHLARKSSLARTQVRQAPRTAITITLKP